MQFSTVALTLATAMTASATPILARQDVTFSVANFSAGCVPHSSQCLYDFILFQGSAGETAETGVKCNKLLFSDGGLLPAVTDGTCTDSSRTWTVEQATDGTLVVAASQQVTPNSFSTGSHALAATELETTTTGTATVQTYTGPNTFDLI